MIFEYSPQYLTATWGLKLGFLQMFTSPELEMVTDDTLETGIHLKPVILLNICANKYDFFWSNPEFRNARLKHRKWYTKKNHS